MKQDIADALGIKTNKTAIVIFYQTVRSKTGSNRIVETGRTPELPFMEAMEIYAETPNPASQLLAWGSEQERQEVLSRHAEDIVNPQWLEDLFDCI